MASSPGDSRIDVPLPRSVDELSGAKLYEHLKEIASEMMKNERAGHTLQSTALVNEAYLLMTKFLPEFTEPGGLNCLTPQRAAWAMRRVLIDHARRKRRPKHGGGMHRFDVEDQQIVLSDREGNRTSGAIDMEKLHSALERLRQLSPRQADVVDLRFFTGKTEAEIATLWGSSIKEVKDEWRHAKQWLGANLGPNS